jgi:Subtilase family
MSSQATRIGIVDSGVHLHHPHVGGIAGGVTVTDNEYAKGFEDVLGHGTAISALMHSIAPAAQLLAVRVFDRGLATSMERVVRAIDWCLTHDVHIVNLSLGTTNALHRPLLASAIERVQSAGAVLVSAFAIDGQLMLPGSMPGVVGVMADADCENAQYRFTPQGGHRVFSASPYPLPIPGVPREYNLQGVSFAVARISAQLARCRDAAPEGSRWAELLHDSGNHLQRA